MIRIIDGKTFNTDTAALIAQWDNSDTHNPSDFLFERVCIYKSKAGACFSVTYTPLRGKCMRLLSDVEILAVAEKIENARFVLDNFPALIVEG